MTQILLIKNLSYSYGSTEVLSKVSISVIKGDFVGLIGPNGSGKTTLLKLILGLTPLQKGTISVCGSDLREFTEWNKIGYVPQKAASIEENFPATVREVVATGLLSTKTFPRTYTKEDESRIRTALKKVDMEKFQAKRIGELSGGQQQRVLIARALIAEPQLLILDEPTTGVDQKTQQKFYDMLGKLNKEGITIMLVTHDLGTITHYVTKVASLNRTLEFYGNHSEFCRHPAGQDDHHCIELRRKYD